MQDNKPTTYNGDLHNLPEALNELKPIPNWVMWKWEKDKKGNWKKPPYQPDGSYAKCNDPNTWSSYDDVIDAYADGEFDGIGFCLLNSKFAAYDLDKCLKLETKEISDFAHEIIEQVGSYSEVSPSGTGVRIIGRATGGKINTKNGNVEIYRDASRYITITGKALNGTTALDNIDAHIDAYQKEPSKEPKSSSNNLIPLRDIMEEEFEPIKWVLPHYVTEGCTLFVGRPKIGKRAGSGFFDRAISGISA